MNLKTAFVYGPYLMLIVTFFAFVLRCRFRVRAQAVWAMLLLVCFSKFLVYRELGGDAFTPELSEHLIWIWNWAYSGAFVLGVLAVLTVFVRVPKRAIVLPLVAWGFSAWGVWNGITPPTVREVTLDYPDLPTSLDGYRIVQLTDIHVSSAARRWRTERIVGTANACGGDLVVITGDIVDGHPHERWRDVEPLKELKARDGVYAITGNHEKYFFFDRWKPFYDRWGIRFLSNAGAAPRAGLALGGVDDVKVRAPSVARAFASATNGAFRVLLQHRPGWAEDNIRAHNVRLQLSGHTHGGIFPGMAWLVSRYNRGLVRGLYAYQDSCDLSFAYVSAGAGQWAGFPIRFFTPTEISVFTLRRSAGK